jgi:hypothetical protein
MEDAKLAVGKGLELVKKVNMNYAPIIIAVVVTLVLFFTLVLPIFTKKNKSFQAVTRTYNQLGDGTDTFRNYYCKASYNSCASGDFVNDWVNLSALSNAIQNGCRFLDFEIYDIGGEPEVAVSASVSFSTKGCYNSIPLAKVFQKVKAEALGTLTADPIILNFRVKCDHAEVCNKMAALLARYFSADLLNNTFGYAKGRLGVTRMSDLMNKVIISADLSNKTVVNSALGEFVNMGGSSTHCQMLRFTTVTQSPPSDFDTFLNKNLVITIPDLVTSSSNYDSAKVMSLGVQFAAMNFQRNDSNLEAYQTEFDGYGFILKPADLRYYPTEIPDAPPLPPEQRYSNAVTPIRAGNYTRQLVIPASS